MNRTTSIFGCALLATSLWAASSKADDESRRPKPRVEWVWFNAEGGVEIANLRTFNANLDTLSVGLTPTSGVGPAVGVGAGVRLLFVTLGLRGRLGAMQSRGGSWQIWTLDPEIGVRIPLQRFEPYFTLGAGYASLGSFGHAISGLGSGLDVSGVNVRFGVGLDVYVNHWFSIGGLASAEALFLARDGVALRELASAKQLGSIDDAKAKVLETDGTSAGGALTFSLVLGFHI